MGWWSLRWMGALRVTLDCLLLVVFCMILVIFFSTHQFFMLSWWLLVRIWSLLPGYFVLNVESDSATVISYITSHGSVQWDYVYLFGWVVLCLLLPLSWSSIFFARLLLQLISWPIELVLKGFTNISWVLESAYYFV